MPRTRLTRSPAQLLLLVAVLVGPAIGVALDRTAFAQQPAPAPGIKRTILTRSDDPGNPGYEAIMGVAEIAPGQSSGKHIHHGIELAYVMDGQLTIRAAGKAPVTYHAGQAMTNPFETVHDATNNGTTPVRILAVYIVKKGVPLAEPVK